MYHAIYQVATYLFYVFIVKWFVNMFNGRVLTVWVLTRTAKLVKWFEIHSISLLNLLILLVMPSSEKPPVWLFLLKLKQIQWLLIQGVVLNTYLGIGTYAYKSTLNIWSYQLYTYTLQSPKKHSEDRLWIHLLPTRVQACKRLIIRMYIVHMRHYTIVKLALSVIVLLPNGTLLRESADDVWLEITALAILSL